MKDSLPNTPTKTEALVDVVLRRLRSWTDPDLAEVLIAQGWKSTEVLGVDLTTLEQVGKTLRQSRGVAEMLWDKRLRETMIVAAYAADPKVASEELLDSWVTQAQHPELAEALLEGVLARAPAARRRAASWVASDQPHIHNIGCSLCVKLGLNDEELEVNARFPGFFPPTAPVLVGRGGSLGRVLNALVRFLARENRSAAAKAVRRARQAELQRERDGAVRSRRTK